MGKTKDRKRKNKAGGLKARRQSREGSKNPDGYVEASVVDGLRAENIELNSALSARESDVSSAIRVMEEIVRTTEGSRWKEAKAAHAAARAWLDQLDPDLM